MKEKETLERVKILFKAFIDMYEAQDKTPYVIGIQESVAIWDEVECDANCLKEEMEDMIWQIDELLEHIPNWHLVSDNDFPTNDDNRFYLCIYENHEEDIPTMFQYDSELGFGWWEDIYDQHTLGFVDSEFHTVEEEHLEKVIAWCELPKFDGVE